MINTLYLNLKHWAVLLLNVVVLISVFVAFRRSTDFQPSLCLFLKTITKSLNLYGLAWQLPHISNGLLPQAGL